MKINRRIPKTQDEDEEVLDADLPPDILHQMKQNIFANVVKNKEIDQTGVDKLIEDNNQKLYE
jgi:hypothetical protein